MASQNRTAQLTKLYKVLKKHYQPVVPPSGRSMLENMLFACCLENAPYAAAEQAYQAVATGYFDWNEVRVSTVRELSEVMKNLPDPAAAAERLKRSLQGTFEATYSFEMELLKKQNLGQAIQKLEKYGCSPFVVSYIVQTSLAGHSVPLDAGAVGSLIVLGILPENAKAKDGCPGMERAIPKNKGLEFGSLLHQLSVDYVANPYAPKLHAFFLEVDSESKARLPKKQPKTVKKETPPPPPAPPASAAKGAKPGDKTKPADKKPEDKKKDAPSAKKPVTTAATTVKKPTPPAVKKPTSSASAKKPVGKSSTTLTKRKPR